MLSVRWRCGRVELRSDQSRGGLELSSSRAASADDTFLPTPRIDEEVSNSVRCMVLISRIATDARMPDQMQP